MIKDRIKEFKSEYKKLRATEKSTKKTGKAYCKSEYPGKKNKSERDECLKKLEVDIKTLETEITKVFADLNAMLIELDVLQKNRHEIKEQSKDMREAIRNIKRSLLQEYMLFKRCAFLGYRKSNSTQKILRLK